jgi:tRNA(fMet)-specific endonuclease VapC
MLLVSPEDVALCDIVKAELFYGAERSQAPERNLAILEQFLSRFRSFPFDGAAAKIHGRVKAALASRGALIGPHDLLIAAIAIANGLALVTHNVQEFSRIDGLVFEDWEIPS